MEMGGSRKDAVKRWRVGEGIPRTIRYSLCLKIGLWSLT